MLSSTPIWSDYHRTEKHAVSGPSMPGTGPGEEQEYINTRDIMKTIIFALFTNSPY